MRSGFRSLKDVFNNEKSLSGIRETVKELDVIVEFFEIFPGMEKVIIPQNCEKKILKLKVENPSWRNELKFMESEMIEKINNHFNEKRINQIRLVG
jgi:hypothetical protein